MYTFKLNISLLFYLKTKNVENKVWRYFWEKINKIYLQKLIKIKYFIKFLTWKKQ